MTLGKRGSRAAAAGTLVFNLHVNGSGEDIFPARTQQTPSSISAHAACGGPFFKTGNFDVTSQSSHAIKTALR